jgi:hypothetical protein
MRKAVTLLLSLVATLAFAQTPPQSNNPNNKEQQQEQTPAMQSPNPEPEQAPAMQSPNPEPAETQPDQPALSNRPEPLARDRDIPLGTEIRAMLDTPLSSRVSA